MGPAGLRFIFWQNASIASLHPAVSNINSLYLYTLNVLFGLAVRSAALQRHFSVLCGLFFFAPWRLYGYFFLNFAPAWKRIFSSLLTEHTAIFYPTKWYCINRPSWAGSRIWIIATATCKALCLLRFFFPLPVFSAGFFLPIA